MSVNNFSNFNMPSLNGLVDINADSVTTTDLQSNDIQTVSLEVNGVDIGAQVNENKQKLTAISYLSTPTPTTTINSNEVVNGELQIYDPSNPSDYIRLFHDISAYGFKFQLESPNQIMYFKVKNGTSPGQYKTFYFASSQIYSDIYYYQANDFNMDYNKDFWFGDHNSLVGGGIKYIPTSNPTDGLKFLNNNNSYYTNFSHKNNIGVEVPTFRMNYQTITSLIAHVMSSTLQVSGNTTLTNLGCNGTATFYNTVTLLNNIIANSATITPTQMSYLSTLTSNVQTQLNNKLDLTGGTITGALTLNGLTYLNNNILANSATISPAELSYLDGVSSNLQTQLNNKLDLTGGTISGGITFNGVVNLNNNIVANALTISPIELSYLDNASSNIQGQLNSKLDKTGGTVSGPVNFSSDVDIYGNGTFNNTATFNAQSYFNAKLQCYYNIKLNSIAGIEIGLITISQTELSYLSGVTSAIQTQLNNKLSLSGGAVTGTTNFLSNVNIYGNTLLNSNVSFGGTIMTGLDVSGSIDLIGNTSSTNQITSSYVVGDVTGFDNILKYTSIKYHSNSATGTANPALTITDAYNNSSLYVLPNSSSGAYNNLVGLGTKSIIAMGTQDSNNICLTNWSTTQNGFKATATNSTTTQCQMISGSNSVTTHSINGTSMTGVSSIAFSGGTTITSTYGTIYTATLNATTLTTATNANVSSALSLPAGIYMVSWICTFHVITGSTTVGNYYAGCTTSSSSYTDAISRGSYSNQTIILDSYFSVSGNTILSLGSTTNVYLRCQCVFGTASRVEFNDTNSSMKAVKIA